MPVFGAGALTAFFTHATQLGLTSNQRAALAAEGLATPDDFQDFKQELQVAFKNTQLTTPPVPIPARCTARKLIASVAWNYYRDTGRQPTPANMNFTNVLRDFDVEWKAI